MLFAAEGNDVRDSNPRQLLIGQSATAAPTSNPHRRARLDRFVRFWPTKYDTPNCLSPTGYSTDDKDAGCSPDSRSSARPRSLVRLALCRTIRCLSRLTKLASRIAPPRVLSLGRHSRRTAVLEPRYFPRIAWPQLPTANHRQRRRPDLPGSTAPHRARRGVEWARPFTAVADGYRRQAANASSPKARAVRFSS